MSALLTRIALLAQAVSALQVTVDHKENAPHDLSLKYLQKYTFEDFVKEFDRHYERGSEEWKEREELFNIHLQQVLAHASGPQRSWSMGITRFMDHTDEEYKKMLGYKGRGSPRKSSSSAPGQKNTEFLNSYVIVPDAFEVTAGELGSQIRDQGSCGSCWAEAATSVLEGHLELNKSAIDRVHQLQLNWKSQMNSRAESSSISLSSQTIVACTPNKRHCGGTGGCEGATVELAYDMVKEKGLPLAAEFPYEAGLFGVTGPCTNAQFKNAAIGITGYALLPMNELNPLIQALSSVGGPIAVSVDATRWNFYKNGIYSDTDYSHGDFEVNHAVTLVGFKRPTPGKGDGYWKLKNSWGKGWGEQGYIRIDFKEDEGNHCGMDMNVHLGLGCDGDPDTALVCGTCGILYDSVYPQGVHVIS